MLNNKMSSYYNHEIPSFTFESWNEQKVAYALFEKEQQFSRTYKALFYVVDSVRLLEKQMTNSSSIEQALYCVYTAIADSVQVAARSGELTESELEVIDELAIYFNGKNVAPSIFEQFLLIYEEIKHTYRNFTSVGEALNRLAQAIKHLSTYFNEQQEERFVMLHLLTEYSWLSIQTILCELQFGPLEDTLEDEIASYLAYISRVSMKPYFEKQVVTYNDKFLIEEAEQLLQQAVQYCERMDVSLPIASITEEAGSRIYWHEVHKQLIDAEFALQKKDYANELTLGHAYHIQSRQALHYLQQFISYLKNGYGASSERFRLYQLLTRAQFEMEGY